MALDHFALLLIAAWFVQMGAHEGAHAHVADRLGDDTAALQGKRSFNPLVHINWHEPRAVVLGVVAPVVTALMGLVPMGMAWVPVNPRRLRGWRRDMALVSVAGPIANLLLSLLCLPVHMVIAGWGYTDDSLLRILDELAFAIYLTSAVYGLFNLIPIPPLDGSRVLHYFLTPWGRGVMDQLAPYGMMMLVALFFVGPGGGLLDVPLSAAYTAWAWAGMLL